jgi:hypothetical protein
MQGIEVLKPSLNKVSMEKSPMGTIAYREQQVGTKVHRWWSHPLPGYGTQLSKLWVELVHIMEVAMLQRTVIRRSALKELGKEKR